MADNNNTGGKQPINITVLISGSGTNLQALIDNQTWQSDENSNPNPEVVGKFPSNARITHVISNRKNAYGLLRAEKANIPTTYHNLVPYKKRHKDTEGNDTEEGVQKAREEYDRDLADIIINHTSSSSSSTETGSKTKPDLVVCAGWMHILSQPFIDALAKADVAIINLHPALPGQFDGADAIQRAWNAFQRGEIVETGVMVHHVIGEVDRGTPILVREVECIVGEIESDLEARIHKVEWGLIVDATVSVLKEIELKRKQ